MKRMSDFDQPHPVDIDERFHILNASAVGRVLYWGFFCKLVRGVPGSIVECGVGRGRSLLIISALNALYEQDEGGRRDIWAFDSFAGFDEPSPQDDSSRNPRKGEWASGRVRRRGLTTIRRHSLAKCCKRHGRVYRQCTWLRAI